MRIVSVGALTPSTLDDVGDRPTVVLVGTIDEIRSVAPFMFRDDVRLALPETLDEEERHG